MQYIPGVALGNGTVLESRIDPLSLLSVAAFLGMSVIWLVVARRGGDGACGPGLLIVLIGSPFLFYANSTFGEMLAGATWMAGLTKETAAPCILAMGIIGIVG